MDGYDFVFRDEVRFRDLDGMGHVNNAVFLTYLESARIAYMEALGSGANPQQSLILARIEIDFRSPISLGEEVEVGVRTSRIGTKSFDLEYEIRADGRLAADAKSVLVAYDYSTASSTALPQRWRDLLEGGPRMRRRLRCLFQAGRALPVRPSAMTSRHDGRSESRP